MTRLGMHFGLTLAIVVMLASPFGCGGERGTRGSEGLDVSTLPAEVRGDYDVFARRCSKCHSLSRPLNSGIEGDDYWARYVARMRRQPASGISQSDEVVILRFLHYYWVEQKHSKLERENPDAGGSVLEEQSDAGGGN